MEHPVARRPHGGLPFPAAQYAPPAPPPNPAPLLKGMAEHVSNTLAQAHLAVSRVENGVDRLVGSEPQTESAAIEGKPVTDTLERQIRELGSLAERLLGRITDAAKRLDAAV